MKTSSIDTAQNGTVFLVDISGFTSFVRDTDSNTGAKIISRLLETIISVNVKSFDISEIEGDAILFYRYGKPMHSQAILDLFEDMLCAFKKKVTELRLISTAVTSLSIKMIAHYVEIQQYKVAGFRKLYGRSLIEAHRLLKNGVHRDTYALITDQYMLKAAKANERFPNGFQQCESYDIGKLCYTYFPYAELLNNSSQLALVS